MGDLFFFLVPHRLVRIRKGSFSFSIRFIPSVDYTASASGVGTPDRMTTMDDMTSHARLAGAPYIIMRHLHTVAEELGSRCSPLPPRTDVAPLHPGHIGSRTGLPSIIPVLVNSLKLRKDKSNRHPLLM